MTYLFSRTNRPGLEALIASLGAVRLPRFDGESFWDKAKKNRITLNPDSVIIPIGEDLPELEGIRVLNGREKSLNEVEIYETLSTSGVRSCKNYPETLNTPSAWTETKAYIPRKFGKPIWPYTNDPDYYTEQVVFIEEYVVHSFNGRSIRAGIKKPMSGRTIATSVDQYKLNSNSLAHPTIKTRQTGWAVDHTTSSTPELRAIAHKAVKALGLTFGVVTVGKMATGSGTLQVISVGLNPDFSNATTLKAYSKAILKWIQVPNVPSTEGGI